MRELTREDIKDLRKKGNIKAQDGGKYKRQPPVRGKAKTVDAPQPPAFEERQTKAMETLVAEIAMILRANDKNATILLQMMKKMDINIEMPEPAKKWEHMIVSRDSDGKIEKIVSEAV